MKIRLNSLHKKLIFHISLWGIWLYLTLSNVNDADFYNRAVLITSLIVFTHLPLFIFNTEWLIPNILFKKGVTIYFWSLILTILIFSFFHSFIFSSVNEFLGVQMLKGFKSVKGIIAIVLVAAISTGYGLLSYVVEQEKNQQEKQKERLQSELSFLRSQISPHFIFNILNSIVYLIRSKSDLAEPVTLKLSDLMRYMLYESENVQIPLEKEILYVENFVELQKIRFEEDVDIHYTLEGEAGSQLIEPMLFIPFVENAFKHGVGLVLDPTIDIHFRISEKEVLFSVKNKISADANADKDNSSGIGLKNVRRRLELLYPETHQLDIDKEDDWFKVTLRLKF